jgi:hypothetical protein
MRRFHQTSKFIGRNQGHVTRAAAAHKDNLTVVRHLIEKSGKPCTQGGVGSFYGHSNNPPKASVQVFCTFVKRISEEALFRFVLVDHPCLHHS